MALPAQCGPTKQMKSVFVQKQPLNEFSQSFADTLFQLFTAMYLVWAFAPQLQTTLSHIVEEKETLIKVPHLCHSCSAFLFVEQLSMLCYHGVTKACIRRIDETFW
jgi:hypothetical protein